MWHECKVVPQLRGYHNWRKFLRIVFEGTHEDCNEIKTHYHNATWVEVLLDYLEVDCEPSGYHRLRKYIRAVYS